MRTRFMVSMEYNLIYYIFYQCLDDDDNDDDDIGNLRF